MLRIREKAKIDPRRKRFGMVPTEGDSMLIIDRDAESACTVEKDGRHVARVTKLYARAVCDALNLISTDHNALLALMPAKRVRVKAAKPKKVDSPPYYNHHTSY